MLQTLSPQSEAVARPLAEHLTVLVKTDSKKGRGLLSRLRSRHTEHVVRHCIQSLGNHGLEGIGGQLAAWLSTIEGYGSLLLDPAFLTVEQAKRVAKIMRTADAQFSLKILKGFGEASPAEVLTRALVILDTARERATAGAL